MKKVRFLFVLLALTVVFSVCAFADGEEARDVSYENTLATDLKALGLFSGVSENNFDLERIPTRTEVLVMLIRVLARKRLRFRASGSILSPMCPSGLTNMSAMLMKTG